MVHVADSPNVHVRLIPTEHSVRVPSCRSHQHPRTPSLLQLQREGQGGTGEGREMGENRGITSEVWLTNHVMQLRDCYSLTESSGPG